MWCVQHPTSVVDECYLLLLLLPLLLCCLGTSDRPARLRELHRSVVLNQMFRTA
jgi:hypothetical protein